MPYDGRAVANLVLDASQEVRRKLTNLSLQKIVYFCHIWSLIRLDRPLIRHQFEAWQYGPVLPYLYREFRAFDRTPISARAMGLNAFTGMKEVVSAEFDFETVRLLKPVVNFYNRLSASQLVELSHVPGGPWHTVWNHDGSVNPGMKIDDRIIKEFYSRVSAPFAIQ